MGTCKRPDSTLAVGYAFANASLPPQLFPAFYTHTHTGTLHDPSLLCIVRQVVREPAIDGSCSTVPLDRIDGQGRLRSDKGKGKEREEDRKEEWETENW